MTEKPKLIAFDLDGTVWSPDMYMLWGGGAPFSRVGDGSRSLQDRKGETVRLLGVSGPVFEDLRHGDEWTDTVCALVSCTDEPAWAEDCLSKFTTPSGHSLKSCVDSSQIYKANKKVHFQNLRKDFPHIEYTDMMFFDNEEGNIHSVSTLGVHCVYCPEGLTDHIWRESLKSFATGRHS